MDKLKSAATRAAGEKTAGVRVPSKKTVVAVVIFALLALAPFVLPIFRVSLVGKYMCFAIIAVGLDVI